MKGCRHIFAAIFLICFVVFQLLTHYLVSHVTSQKQYERNVAVASRLYDAVVSEITEPLTVARSMACDSFLISALIHESDQDLQHDVVRFTNYLLRIKNMFRFKYACVISDATRRYYRNDGLLKVLDPVKDPQDMWYSAASAHQSYSSIGIFKKIGDEADASLYVNERIMDGLRVIGVARTSVSVYDVLSRIAAYELEYGVKINLTDASGLIKLDTNYVDINVGSLAYLVQSKKGTDTNDFRLVRHGVNGFAAVRHIPQIDWYFVIRDTRTHPSMPVSKVYYVFSVLLVAAVIVLLYTADRRKRPAYSYTAGKSSQLDGLTGLPNRNFFKEMFGERGLFNTMRFRSLAVFDIDFFKEANDTLNGDEVLVSVTEAMSLLLKERGIMLRWGGDEFLVLFEISEDEAYELCRQFCRNVEAVSQVTVSVGLVDVHISDSIKKNYYRAARCCYLVKEMGGNGVKME